MSNRRRGASRWGGRSARIFDHESCSFVPKICVFEPLEQRLLLSTSPFSNNDVYTIAEDETLNAGVVRVLETLHTGFDEAEMANGEQWTFDEDYVFGVASDTDAGNAPRIHRAALPSSYAQDNASPFSTWIGRNDLNGFSGFYVFERTFDLTGINVTNARLAGVRYMADDGPVSIFLNGTPVLLNDPAGFGSFIDLGEVGNGLLVSGVNTLSATVDDSGGAMAFRLEAWVVDDAQVGDESSVIANDTDDDGDTLSAFLIQTPKHGQLLFKPDGSFTYLPDAGFFGVDTFLYKTTDGTNESNVAEARIHVNPLPETNTAPTAHPDTYSTLIDTPLSATSVLQNDTDPQSNVLSAQLVTGVQFGTLSLAGNGTFTYTPDFGFTGFDSFTYTASDVSLASNVANVSIAVQGAGNVAPVAHSDGYSTEVNHSLVISAAGVLANDVDANGDNLTAQLETDVSNGTLALNTDGSFSYTPGVDFVGVDSFTYRALDGAVLSDAVAVTIAVNNNDFLPVALDDFYGLDQGSSLNLPGQQPLLDHTVITPGNLYATNYPAFETNFLYELNDEGAIAEMDFSDETEEPRELVIDEHGLIHLWDGVFNPNLTTYNPATGEFSFRTFQGWSTANVTGYGGLAAYKNFVFATDQNTGGGPERGVVRFDLDTGETIRFSGGDPIDLNIGLDQKLYVLHPNSGTIAQFDPITLIQERSFAVDVPRGIAVDFNGHVYATGGNLGTSVAHYDENGQFINDLDLGFGGLIDVDIDPSGKIIVTSHGGPVFVTDRSLSSFTTANTRSAHQAWGAIVPTAFPHYGVLANDFDAGGDALTATLIDGPDHAAQFALNTDGGFTYTPDRAFTGTDSFTYVANDGTSNSEAVTVYLIVNDINLAPDVADEQFTIDENEVLRVGPSKLLDTLHTGFDDQQLGKNSDGFADDDYAFGSGSPVDAGTYAVVDRTPSNHLMDDDVSDLSAWVGRGGLQAGGGTMEFQRTIDVAASDVASAQLVGIQFAADGTLTSIDVNGLAQTGPVSGSFGTFNRLGDVGSGSFQEGVNTVTLNVNKQSGGMGLRLEGYIVADSTGLPDGVLGNDMDIDGDVITTTIVDAPIHGKLVLMPDGSFEYHADVGFSGVDSFTYIANDGELDSDLATVTVTVNDLPDPQASNDQYVVGIDQVLRVGPTAVITNVNTGFNDATMMQFGQNAQDDDYYFGAGSVQNAGQPAIAQHVSSGIYLPSDASPLSSWISKSDFRAAGGLMEFERIVDITGFDPTTTRLIDLQAVTDGSIKSVELNGQAISPGFATPYKPFRPVPDMGEGAFQSGENILTINLNKGSGGMGLRMEGLVVADAAPDAQAGLLANDPNASDSIHTVELVNGPQNGQLFLLDDGSFAYHPDSGFTGNDSFTYLINYGAFQTGPATVMLAVDPSATIDDVIQNEGDTGRTSFDFTVSLGAANSETVTIDYATSNDNATGLRTTRIANGLSQPVFVTAAPGDLNRLFIVEKGGAIRILDLNSGTVLATPFVTVPDVFNSNERGLLGLAFHPNFANNGLFYTSYSKTGGAFGQGVSHITQWSVDGDPLMDNTADPNSQVEVLSFDQPFSNHNGGWIGFGPNDGMLYITSGDGGSGNDPLDSGQSLDTLLGKILRIDVNGDDFPADANRNYAIPIDNPFAVDGDPSTLAEIWAYGLRNPWRPSFDRGSSIGDSGRGDFYIADVGQSEREEINVQLADSVGGENYGWRLREGTIATPSGGVGGPLPTGAVDPIYDYERIGQTSSPDFEGNSVTGGFVYRGPITGLDGHYFFGDFVTSNLWSLDFDGSDPTTHDGTNFTDLVNRNTDLAPDNGSIDNLVSFGEDTRGNLYLVDIGGEVFRLDPMSDFQPASGTLTFQPGETTKTITVDVFGDLHEEADETFLVTLSNPVGAGVIIGDAVGVGTILNDDAADETPPELGGGIVATDVPLLADAYVQRTLPNDNFGDSDGLILKNSTSGFDRKAYLKFDTSGLDDVQDATLELSFIEVGGDAGLIDWEFQVYGLLDGDIGEQWIEGSGGTAFVGPTPPDPIVWNNAPANNTASGNLLLNNAMSLGTFSLFGKVGDISFSSQALVDYLNLDTNDVATLIIARNTPETGSNSNIHLIASAEHATESGPKLTVETTPPPPTPLDDQRSVVRQLSFQFSEQVFVSSNAIQIMNMDLHEMVDPSTFLLSYDGSTLTATWTFPLLPGGTLPDGNYEVFLMGSLVFDAAGNAMSGDVSFEFHRYYGDTDGDRSVGLVDLFEFRSVFQTVEGDANFNLALDNDFDGDVDFVELFLFRSRFGTTFPAAGESSQQAQQAPQTEQLQQSSALNSAPESAASDSSSLMQHLAAWQPPETQAVHSYVPVTRGYSESLFGWRNEDADVEFDDSPQSIESLLNESMAARI